MTLTPSQRDRLTARQQRRLTRWYKRYDRWIIREHEWAGFDYLCLLTNADGERLYATEYHYLTELRWQGWTRRVDLFPMARAWPRWLVRTFNWHAPFPRFAPFTPE